MASSSWFHSIGSNSALKKLLVSSRLGRNGGDSNKENHADKSAGCVAAVAVPCSHDYELSNDRPSDEWMCFLETKVCTNMYKYVNME